MLLLRGATTSISSVVSKSKFQYMLLLRGATPAPERRRTLRRCFNTCSSCEEQLSQFVDHKNDEKFQYMLLLRGATGGNAAMFYMMSFQYMLLLRGATRTKCPRAQDPRVSIHAPLARSNKRERRAVTTVTRFNTCSSCEEQPAPFRSNPENEVVSIHAPLARSNSSSGGSSAGKVVSIHAPLARSNRCASTVGRRVRCFNTCSSCEEQPSGK